jgi:ribosomal protein S17E
MYALYTDDSILAGPDQDEIDQIIKEMKEVNLDITVEGDLQDFLGVNIERMADGSIQLTQPHLIDQILDDLRLNDDNVTEKTIPATSSRLLSRHSDSEAFDNSFNYRSVIGKLNYLEKSTRSDIAYITHQLARFSAEPKKEHGQALRWLGRYLKATRTKGTILRIDETKDMEVYVDADFSGNWDPNESQDRDSARSRHGYIIMYAGCTVLWKSQMQTEIALSSTESEYTGLSYALRDAIPIMELLKEM